MIATNLLFVCAAVFSVVFSVLALLAAAMRLITILFPESVPGPDGVVYAAIASTLAVLGHGTRVTRIEEES